jgi:hypothetical protein
MFLEAVRQALRWNSGNWWWHGTCHNLISGFFLGSSIGRILALTFCPPKMHDIVLRSWTWEILGLYDWTFTHTWTIRIVVCTVYLHRLQAIAAGSLPLLCCWQSRGAWIKPTCDIPPMVRAEVHLAQNILLAWPCSLSSSTTLLVAVCAYVANFTKEGPTV